MCLLAGRQILSALQESQTIDEAAHLVAGYSYWKTRDFRLTPSHPPLAELLAALPLLPLQPVFLPSAEAWEQADENVAGQEFLYQNRMSADTLLFAGRMMTIVVTLTLGLTIAWWVRKRFGAAAALCSLFLFTFDPTIIAHGHYITTDMAVTAFLFWSCLSWLAYLESGKKRQLLQTGILAGLTFASKFNGLILYPVFLFLYVLYRRRAPVSERRRPSLRMLFLAFVIVPFWIVYALNFFDTRSFLDDPRLGPRLQQTTGITHALAQIPIPAYYYVRGLHLLLRDLQAGHPTYLLGKQAGRGSWLYFPVAFAVKTPLATLLLLSLCAVVVLLKIYRRIPLPVVWLALGVLPLVYFLVSLTSSLNIGVRHLLPIYPFLFVLLAAILFEKVQGSYASLSVGCSLVFCGLLAVESLSIHPHYLAFSNSLAGGPRNGSRYLLNSNLDWGQDLKNLKRWADQHAAAPLCLSYFGIADPKYYGIDSQPLPSVRDVHEASDLDCVVAVSAHHLFGTESERFLALRELVPQAYVGYSIYVYDLRKNREEWIPPE